MWLFALLLLIPLKDSQPISAQDAYDHAWRLFQSGDLALSRQEAESEFRKYQISNPAWAGKFQLIEANSLLFQGKYDDALRVLSDDHSSGVSNESVEKLRIEAAALTHQQQEPAAEDRLARAEAICKDADFPSCGDVLAARAILLARQGHRDQAKQTLLQALSFAQSHHDVWSQVTSCVNLGYMAMQVDHYDEAVDWSRRAYGTAVTMGYEDLAQIAVGNIGWSYFQLGDDDRALEQYLAAEKTAARLGDFRNELKWLSDAGYVYRDSGDLPRAAQSYRRALDLARQIQSREDIVNALEDLADISVVTNNLDGAGAYIRQVMPMETARGARPRANLVLTMGKLAAARGQFSEAEADFHSVQNDPASLMTARLVAGYQLATLAESQNNTAVAERRYKAALASYESARVTLKSEESQLPYGTNAIEIYDRYIRLLVHEGRTDAALAVAEQSRAQTLEEGLSPSGDGHSSRPAVFDPRQIAQKTRSTLLFYSLGEKESYLWAITPTKTAFYTLPAGDEIASRVARYSKAVLNARDPLETGNADGQALYKMLVAPAGAAIRPGMRVIVLADSNLSQLNFETLIVPGPAANTQQGPHSSTGMHYLIDDLTLSSAPSLAMLATGSPAHDAGRRMLLLGNPVSADPDFPGLPMFGYEMHRIEGHFAPAQLSVFAGQQATPAAYLASNPRQYSYIHFVSHAVASRVNPLDSAIILSSSAGQEDSYKLYAREIIQHPIDAQLVTISACYGSGTRAYAGEGLVGLSWAFLRAGAQRVIGALWEVSDDSTPRLMDNLYQGLADGQPPAVALRNAKLALLHSQSRFRMPYYWAPFQIYIRR